jgi:anaerobic ribonucleoside-triphosphate reductase activating protein
LRVYKIVSKTRVLGKGIRFGLWLQGCDKKCKGCLVPDSWDKKGGVEVGVDEIVKIFIESGVEGITISGGEPILQSEELLEFLLKIKDKRDVDVILYTGFKLEDIIKNPLLKEIDLLIDGEYIDELNNNTPLIGSDNQGVYVLSDKGMELFEYMREKRGREIEIFDDFIVGIPFKENR